MQAEIERVREDALRELSGAKDFKELEGIKNRYLSRKGILAGIMKGVSSLPAGERPLAGKKANELKKLLASRTAEVEKHLGEKSTGQKKRVFDRTLPGVKPSIGRLHPVTGTIMRIEQIFGDLGFKPASGPEIENEYYNFEALNYPPDHPARDEQDSFYLDDKNLLRSQTSPVQVRVMEKHKPPVRIIASGKCFRRDASDASHSPQFHQVEGLLVDRGISFSDLKGVLDYFVKNMFGTGVETRFRPDFFPFTEPSAEISISCGICVGGGCSSCGGKGWLEILGAGMVDPGVFEKVGYDPEVYTGFAFGMGVERIAMLKYGIHDLRLFLENDLRFLEQF